MNVDCNARKRCLLFLEAINKLSIRAPDALWVQGAPLFVLEFSDGKRRRDNRGYNENRHLWHRRCRTRLEAAL